MRKYLVNGYLEFPNKPYRCILSATATLEDHEVMDLQTLRTVEAILFAELLELRKDHMAEWAVPSGFKVTGFQPFEQPAVPPLAKLQPAAFTIQLNECSVIMPPVDSPILIEIAPGVLLRASRPAHAEARGDQLVFNLETHGQFVGRPRWTHP